MALQRWPALSSLRRMPQMRAAVRSCVLLGSASGVHRMVPSGVAMTRTFMPCTRCLPEW